MLNPVIGYDVTVGMLQGQGLHSLAAIRHPWAEKAFYALPMIAGDTTEFSEWMAPGADFRTMFRANRIRPWEASSIWTRCCTTSAVSSPMLFENDWL